MKIRASDLILAIIGVLIGGALAVVCLVFKPVQTTTKLPPPHAREAGQVYYIAGSRDRTKGVSWTQKRHALLTAMMTGEIILTEDELNTWFATSTHIKQARKTTNNTSELIRIGQPDFRIDDGLLQVALPTTLEILDSQTPLIVQMRGTFSRAATDINAAPAGVIMFLPSEVFIGSLPLHRIPGATTWLLNAVLEQQALPGEALAAWRKIERATIVGHELHIVITPTLQ